MTIYDYDRLQALVLLCEPTLIEENKVSAVYQGFGRAWSGWYRVIWRLPVGVRPSEDNLQDPDAIVEIVEIDDKEDW
jgi:hypothetical protein